MKPNKIKKVGRILYIYFKIPFYSSYRKMYSKLQKYYDEDGSFEPSIDVTGKYIVISYILRNRRDIEPYLKSDDKICKANEILENILVVKQGETYRPIKNTTTQEVYKTIVLLNEVLNTPHRINYGLLKGEKDVE